MLGEGLEPGDVVELAVNPENRGWGYNPGPDGMRGRVVGFGEIDYSRICNFGYKPGIYYNRCWPIIEFENGTTQTVGVHALKVVDKALYNKRLDLWRERGQKLDDYIRPLPETKFYEGDIFTSEYLDKQFHNNPGTEYTVERISYRNIGELRDDGTKMPEYDFRHPTGGTSWVNEDDMVLVRRGNVWKHFNGEKPCFANIEEEAAFFDMIGETEEVKNPLSGNYAWLQGEIVAAIKVGFAHGMKGPNCFLRSSSYYAIRFKDEELGQRVAAYVLTKYGREPGYLY